MSKYLKLFIFILLAVAIVVSIIVKLETTFFEGKVKPGQVWLYKTNEKNPFGKTEFYYQQVIAVKKAKSYIRYGTDTISLSSDGNYVLYVENGKDTLSCEEEYFLIGNKKVLDSFFK